MVEFHRAGTRGWSNAWMPLGTEQIQGMNPPGFTMADHGGMDQPMELRGDGKNPGSPWVTTLVRRD